MDLQNLFNAKISIADLMSKVDVHNPYHWLAAYVVGLFTVGRYMGKHVYDAAMQNNPTDSHLIAFLAFMFWPVPLTYYTGKVLFYKTAMKLCGIPMEEESQIASVSQKFIMPPR